MSTEPQIIEKDGRKEFVVIPYEDYLRLQEELEDYRDLKALREEKSMVSGDPTRPLDEVLKDIEA
jgi:prevent-host-death family protein